MDCTPGPGWSEWTEGWDGRKRSFAHIHYKSSLQHPTNSDYKGSRDSLSDLNYLGGRKGPTFPSSMPLVPSQGGVPSVVRV